jgi:hypothetical protein
LNSDNTGKMGKEAINGKIRVEEVAETPQVFQIP